MERMGSISAGDVHGFLVSAPPLTANISISGKTEDQVTNCKWKWILCVSGWGPREKGEESQNP